MGFFYPETLRTASGTQCCHRAKLRAASQNVSRLLLSHAANPLSILEPPLQGKMAGSSCWL